MPDQLDSDRLLFGSTALIESARLLAEGPSGRLPFTPDLLRDSPSGDLFGMTQNAGMGWNPERTNADNYLILSTSGGLRDSSGQPIALGYHTGHWELDALVREAAHFFKDQGVLPFAAFCTDPCDGRSQGTPGMMDSLPYRNDAALVARRLIRSLPLCRGVLAVASCDKGLPAMMQALAGSKELPGLVVPGGVTLPARNAEDTAQIQSLGARYAHGMISLDEAAVMGCRACGSPGGGCHFLGTAATAQVVAEALGLAVPHSALAPSGEQVWVESARRSAATLLAMSANGLTVNRILSSSALQNAMLTHAAFGGSTNLLLHLPAIAHAAKLAIPSVEDWRRVNQATPRLVDALPNGPRNHPTVQVYFAGGVPEVMLHLRGLGLLDTSVLTASGEKLDHVLERWKDSKRRRASRDHLARATGIDPHDVILDPDSARRRGMSATLVFPGGNLAPQGAVVKATAIDPSLVDEQQIYFHRGPARVFVSEPEAMRAIKGQTEVPLQPDDVLVLIGIGPLGTGMEEIYQITSALKYLSYGGKIPVLTDGRFSGVSTGPCIGHIGPEALAGGPVSGLRDGDVVEIRIDRGRLTGSINLVNSGGRELSPEDAERLLTDRGPHPGLAPNSRLPSDTRLWALLQNASGGTWSGCVYDVERIAAALSAAPPGQ